jgi:CHAD domain-containing protein
MAVRVATLDRPALAVVTRLARRELRAAERAWGRLRPGGDAEALHDFRVAIRRLRSTLRAYRLELGDVVRPKDRRRLRRLAEATSPARDAEVQLARLRELRTALGRDDRARLSGLVRRLRRRMRDDYAAAHTVIEALFPRTARALGRRLRRAEPPADALPFRIVVGRLVALRIGELRPLLERVPRLDDTRALHRTRIEVKRLRYLLEPVRPMLPGSTLLVHRLERLQDLLGELRDEQVLEAALVALRTEPEPQRPTPAILRVPRARQRGAYREVRERWLGPHAEVVLGPLALLAARLGTARRPVLALRERASHGAVVRRLTRC